jgi:hypothetical protein
MAKTTEMRALSANEIDLVAGGGFSVSLKNNDIAVNIASISQANLSSVNWDGDVYKGTVIYPTYQENNAAISQVAKA